MSEELRWYIVISMASAEWQAHRALQRNCIESYFPYVFGDARRGRWTQGVVRAQFPGYLFVGLTAEQTIWQVEDTIGVKSVLRINGDVVKLSSAQMEICRKRCLATWRESVPVPMPATPYEVDQVVAVPYGPFQGIPCIIESIDRRKGRVYAAIGSKRIDFLIEAPALTELRESVRASA